MGHILLLTYDCTALSMQSGRAGKAQLQDALTNSHYYETRDAYGTPERLIVEVSELSSIITNQLGSMGLAGMVIAILLVAVVVLWRALQQERGRCKDLVDLMLEQSKETATMIERITGR